MSYVVQHRETGCVLLIEGYGEARRDCYVAAVVDGTLFTDAAEAKAAAAEFELHNKQFRITPAASAVKK